MSAASIVRSIGNKVYEHAFPIYKPLYAAYKAYADRAERQLLSQLLFSGAVVVDAGANIGIYSRFLSRCVGPAGTVHCFEPAPANFNRLQSATRTLSNIRVSQAAVGERSGNSNLFLSNTLAVDHHTYPTDGLQRQRLLIEMIALDDYFKPGERVDLIKMDIQGYELHALRGANRVIEENPTIKLLIELWPYGIKQAGACWDDLITLLQEKGMHVSKISAAGLVPFEPTCASVATEDADWYINLFADRR